MGGAGTWLSRYGRLEPKWLWLRPRKHNSSASAASASEASASSSTASSTATTAAPSSSGAAPSAPNAACKPAIKSSSSSSSSSPATGAMSTSSCMACLAGRNRGWCSKQGEGTANNGRTTHEPFCKAEHKVRRGASCRLRQCSMSSPQTSCLLECKGLGPELNPRGGKGESLGAISPQTTGSRREPKVPASGRRDGPGSYDPNRCRPQAMHGLGPSCKNWHGMPRNMVSPGG